MSRLDAGAMRPEISSFPLDDVFRQLQREFEPMARGKGLSLAFAPTSAAIRTDRRLLRRLLQNLVSNAIKYTQKGGVVVGCRRRGTQLAIQVVDTGLGIPASKQKLVFREFERLEQGAKVARGLGLGLSIVERIARTLGHKLTLRSQAGKGSTFEVIVPRVAPHLVQPETPEPKMAQGGALAGMLVLVVENEPAIVDGMRLLLERWGCTVAVAQSVTEAEELASVSLIQPDAIVADYHLGDGDGLDAVRQVRERLGLAIPPRC